MKRSREKSQDEEEKVNFVTCGAGTSQVVKCSACGAFLFEIFVYKVSHNARVEISLRTKCPAHSCKAKNKKSGGFGRLQIHKFFNFIGERFKKSS